MYILDTDTLTHLQKKSPVAIENLKKAETRDAVAISVVTRAEVLRGRIDFLLKANNKEQLEKAQKWLAESEIFLAQWSIIDFDEASLLKFEELLRNSKFRKIGHNDLLIASICLARRSVLVTRNTRHFKPFPNLEVVNWVD